MNDTYLIGIAAGLITIVFLSVIGAMAKADKEIESEGQMPEDSMEIKLKLNRKEGA